jgi:hypothetical protein
MTTPITVAKLKDYLIASQEIRPSRRLRLSKFYDTFHSSKLSTWAKTLLPCKTKSGLGQRREHTLLQAVRYLSKIIGLIMINL